MQMLPAAADPPIDPHQGGGGRRCGSGGPGITDATQVGCGERVRQGSQHGAVGVEQVQDTVVEAGGDPASGEVVTDRMLASGQGEPQAVMVRSTSIAAPV